MKIPLFKNYWDDKDIDYVTKVIKRGMYWANGPEIKEFENRIAEYVGTKYCVAFNSGTSALHAVLLAVEVKNYEVIVPSFTFISTANSVIMAGGKPIFADIEENTFGLDPDDVQEKITSKTKVILPIHYGGCACNIKAFSDLVEDNELILIEDAAESLGAKFGDKMVGTFGDAAMFSFTPTKVISMGEGGVIVTNSKDIFEKLKLIRSHGRLETADYFYSTQYMDYITLGYNFRMPSICAAQGLAQLDKIKEFVMKRRRIAKIYNETLDNIEGIRIPITPKKCHHIYQMYSILIEAGRKKRDELQEYLKNNGITSKVYFEPTHKTYYFKNELGYNIKLEKTELIAGKILSLPIYPGLEDGEISYILEKFKSFQFFAAPR